MITFLGLYGTSFIMSAPHFAERGETVTGSGFFIEPGGKAYNQAVAASRLGADVAFVTAVGDDEYGGLLEGYLAKEGISAVRKAVIKGERTACAFVINSADSESQVYVHHGATAHLRPHHIEEQGDIIRNSQILVLQNEIPVDTLMAAASIAKSHGVKIIYNPAPARQMPLEIYAMAECITPNQTEAAFLAGLEDVDESNLHVAAAAMKKLGAKNIVITLGSRGAAYMRDSEIAVIPAHQITPVSSTGAGDCFNAVLAVMLAQGYDYLGSIALANTAAALSVSREGVIESFPHTKDL